VPDRPATARADPPAPPAEELVFPLEETTGTASATAGAAADALPPPPPPPLEPAVPRAPDVAVAAAGGTATAGGADDGALLLELIAATPQSTSVCGGGVRAGARPKATAAMPSAPTPSRHRLGEPTRSTVVKPPHHSHPPQR